MERDLGPQKKVKSISLEIPQRKLEVLKLVYLLRDNTGVAGVVPKKYVMFRKTRFVIAAEGNANNVLPVWGPRGHHLERGEGGPRVRAVATSTGRE